MNTIEERMPQGVVYIPAGEGRSLWVLGEIVTYKVTSARTGGAYSLFEVTTQPGGGILPPPRELRALLDRVFSGRSLYLYVR